LPKQKQPPSPLFYTLEESIGVPADTGSAPMPKITGLRRLAPQARTNRRAVAPAMSACAAERAGGKLIEVPRGRITGAGRDAL
jgi:hypothetical protein